MERELYERVANAAKEAKMEGDAQVQAAVAAAGPPLPNIPGGIPQFDNWSLKFLNASVEGAYCRKININTDNHDYVSVIFKLALCVPHMLRVLKALSRPGSWIALQAVVPPGQSLIAACQLWHMCVPVLCTGCLAIQFGDSKWYRSHRGKTLWWFVMLLWVCESIKLFLETHVSRNYLLEVVVPSVWMSFLHPVPFNLHLQLRMFGCGCQLAAVLARRDKTGVRLLVPGVIGGHLLGVGVSYVLDRKARTCFRRSLPGWLLDDALGTHQESSRSYRAALSKQMWNIFYPGLFDMSDSRKGVMSAFPGVPLGRETAAPRRALGGFAGGFGGVSGLKCNNAALSFTPIPLSSSSDSSSDRGGDSASSSSGGLLVHRLNQSGSRGLQKWQVRGMGQRSVADRFPSEAGQLGSSSACSQVGSVLDNRKRCAVASRQKSDEEDEW